MNFTQYNYSKHFLDGFYHTAGHVMKILQKASTIQSQLNPLDTVSAPLNPQI